MDSSNIAVDPVEAVHLVPTDSASGLVKRLGASPDRILLLRDRLTVGPCDVLPERHVQLRSAWNAELGWPTPRYVDDVRDVVADDVPLVVWASRAFADLVWLWWVIDGLGRLGAPPRGVMLARPSLADPLVMVGGASPDEALTALTAAQLIQDDVFRAGSELWRRYASPSPLAFDEARRVGSGVFPELRKGGDIYGGWFPRIDGGRLLISEFDELLLECLSDEWTTTQSLLNVIPPGGERLLWPLGSLFPVYRLGQWAAHGVIDRQARSEEDELERDAFRLTDRARSLMQALSGVGDAPPICVGGCRINDPDAPWLRVMDHSGWHLAGTEFHSR